MVRRFLPLSKGVSGKSASPFSRPLQSIEHNRNADLQHSGCHATLRRRKSSVLQNCAEGNAP